MEEVNKIITRVLMEELRIVLFLQSRLSAMEPFFFVFSHYIKPLYITVLWIPILSMFDLKLLIDLEFLATSAIFISLLIKCILPEHRPFWWLEESSKNSKNSKLDVSAHTCAMSAGTVSSHSMVLTVFLLVLGVKVFKTALIKRGYKHNYGTASVYILVALISIVMWTTRMYLGAHFLHQCINGSFVGTFIVYSYYTKKDLRNKILSTSKRKAICFSLLITLGIVFLYWIILMLGRNPHWSVQAAFKSCSKIDILKPTSTPAFALSRVLGGLCGIAASFPLIEKRNKILDRRRCIPAVLIVVACVYCLLESAPVGFGRCVFFSYPFILQFCFTYLILDVIPKYCTKQSPNMIQCHKD